MADSVEQSVSLPAGANALAQAVQKLVLAVVANHKALAGSKLAEVSADVTEAVADLGPVLADVGLLGAEGKADPVGVAEALALAGCGVARSLLTPSPVAAAAAPVAAEAPAAAPAPAEA